MFQEEGTGSNPFIDSSPTPLGAGEGKLRVLYARRQIVSETRRDLTLPDRTLLASVSSLTQSRHRMRAALQHHVI